MGLLSYFFDVIGGVFLEGAPAMGVPVEEDRADESAPELPDLRALFAPGSRVLDLGCGDGRNLLAIEGAGLRVVGTDRSREGLARARARTKAPLVLADAEALPFAVDRFDGIVAWQILCGLPPQSARHGFEQAHRILRADGMLLVAGCEGALRARGLGSGAPGPPGFETLGRERLNGPSWSSERHWVYRLRPGTEPAVRNDTEACP